MGVDIGADDHLERIFSQIGAFGIFQILTLLLICIPYMISASHMVNYIFASNSLEYRCKVAECDLSENNREISYDQPWLKYAIPQTNNGLENCFRYAPLNSSTASQCGANSFNKSIQIGCTEFIYSTDEINVQTEFNIHCDDSYKLALVGSVNSVGRLVLLPITGILSDKFGRLRVVVISVLCCSTFGLIKTFSINYEMYIVLEFLEASAGACIFNGIYVLAIESLSMKQRALATTLLATSFSLGEMILGILAMYIHNFRYLLRAIYAPGLLVIFYFWLVPESIRWLLITGRVNRAIKIFMRIAKINRRKLDEHTIDQLCLQYSSDMNIKNNTTKKLGAELDENDLSMFQQIKMIVGSRKLGLRLLNCGYQWVACFFCYFGLSLISTHIPGTNRYIGYIIVQAVEIPGALLPAFFLNKFGRKKLLFCSLALSGAAAIISPIIPKEQSIVVLILFMIGKSAITFALNLVYIFTAELWPTSLRTIIMNSCSMIGKLGAVAAPLTTLLIVNAPFVPFVLFGVTASLAAFLVLLCPETFGKKLPDTVEEAKDL